MKKENFYRCQLCAKPSSQTRLKGCATWPRKGCGEAIGDVTYLKPFGFYLFCTHLLFCRLSAYFDFWQPAVPMKKLWKFMLMFVRSEFWASEKDQTGRTGISLKMWARAFSQSEVLSIGLQKSYRCFHIAAYRGGQQDLKKIITLMGWEANAVRYLRRNRKALQCFLSYLNLKHAGANVFQITLKLNPLLNNGTPLTRRIWENGDPTFSIAFTIHQFAFSSSLGWFRSFTDCQFAFHIMKGTTTIMQSHVGRWMEMCGFWGWKLVNNRKHATTGSANNNNSHSKSRKSMFFFCFSLHSNYVIKWFMSFCASCKVGGGATSYTRPCLRIPLTLLNIFAPARFYYMFVCCCLDSWRANIKIYACTKPKNEEAQNVSVTFMMCHIVYLTQPLLVTSHIYIYIFFYWFFGLIKEYNINCLLFEGTGVA